jgi:hypothetical protein
MQRKEFEQSPDNESVDNGEHESNGISRLLFDEMEVAICQGVQGVIPIIPLEWLLQRLDQNPILGVWKPTSKLHILYPVTNTMTVAP